MIKKLFVFALFFVLLFTVSFYILFVTNEKKQKSYTNKTTFLETVSTWAVKKSLPTPRTEVAGTSLDGKIYIIGGLENSGNTSSKVEVYDTKNDSWSPAPDLPGARHHTAAVAVAGKLFILGGYSEDSSPTSDIFIYSPETKQWTKGKSMPLARGAHAAVAIATKIYVVGGVTKNGVTGSIHVYDTVTDIWTVKKSAFTKRDHIAIGMSDGLVYVAGGRQDSLISNLDTLEIYNPTTDVWTSGPKMLSKRSGIGGVTIRNAFIVIGGEEALGTFNRVEAFHIEEGKWFSLPPLPTARHGLAVVAVDGKIYAIGGGPKPGLTVSDKNEVLVIK